MMLRFAACFWNVTCHICDIRTCYQDKVQDIGRGTLLAKGDIQEVTGKVKSLYDAYPYPPEAVFDGPTVCAFVTHFLWHEENFT